MFLIVTEYTTRTSPLRNTLKMWLRLNFLKATNGQAKLKVKDRECPPNVLSCPLTGMEELPRS